MTAVAPSRRTRRPPLARRAGYTVAIVVNTVVLYVVHRLLEWDLLPFLTTDFRRVLPIITLSILATMAANVVYVVYDPRWFRSFAEAGVSTLSLVATVRLYEVYPFDFPASAVPWDRVAQTVLIVAIAATVVAIVVNLATGLIVLARGPERPGT